MIKMQMQKIEFANINEMIEMIETRFHNANVDFIESMRDDIIDVYSKQIVREKNSMRTKLILNFDELHDQIERALRNTIAMHFYMQYIENHDRRESLFLLNDVESHNFEIIDSRVNRAIVKFSIAKTSIKINAN